MYKIFFPFTFSFSIENEITNPPSLPSSLFRPFWGGSSATSPLKIWDASHAMPPYLKTLFEQKTEIYNFDHLRPDDPLNGGSLRFSKFIFSSPFDVITVFKTIRDAQRTRNL